MGIYKKFSQEIYDSVDAQACDVILNYLLDAGYYVKRNPDKYGPDVIMYNGYSPSMFIEVEVKGVWRASQDIFPWTHINLPERKGKFLEAGLPIEFWILRQDMAKAVVIPGNKVVASSLQEVPNKYIASGELFYKINLDYCVIVDIIQE